MDYFGFIASLLLYAIAEIFVAVTKKVQLNIKVLIASLCAVVIIIIAVIVIGSNTLQRRNQLNNISEENNTHITNDLLDIKNRIDKNEIEQEYMSKAEKQSILDLYNIANSHKLKNNNMRAQQIIYHLALMKNQRNPLLVLFGNGYQTHFYELILEMEIPAFLCNFGICGFILYFVPILAIFLYGIYMGIKHRKNIDTEYIMYIFGILFGFAFSFLSGYTFFHASSMIIMVVLSVLLIDKTVKLYNIE